MADKFNGFSQDEINKVSGVARAKNSHSQSAEPMKQAFRTQHGIRRMPEKWSRSVDPQRKQQLGSQSSVTTSGGGVTVKTAETKTPSPPPEKEDTLEEINLNSSMSKSIEEALYFQPTKKITGSKNGRSDNKTNGATSNVNSADANESSILKLPTPPTMDSNISSTSSTTTDESSILPSGKPAETADVTAGALNVDSPFKGVSLRDFEAHRKMIEEQNKQKKELLYKAIERHSQKTAAEARKIAEIKNELAKLDNDLALDVSILRKQIDNACIHFAQVEKQYMKIEGQFLKAKIDLHNAAEKKELLTEHLCTVIAHNEDRKAQKLAELMQKVGLTETGEYLSAEPNSTANDK